MAEKRADAGPAESPTVRRAPSRIEGIDALRGIAALGVLAYHYTSGYRLVSEDNSWLVPLPDGRRGVHLFFVISGFVMIRSVASAGSVRMFAQRRFARLYPVFWAAVCVTSFGLVVLGARDLVEGSGLTVPTFLANLTMVPRLLAFPAVDLAYWTLTVELVFYVLIACAFRAGLLRAERLVPFLVGWLLIAQPVGYLAYRNEFIAFNSRIEQLGFGYSHLFVAGMVIEQLTRDREGAPIPHRGGLVALLAVAPLLGAIQFGPRSGIWAVGFLLAVAVLAKPRQAWRPLRPLARIGTISYPLYLVHQNLGYALFDRLRLAPLVEFSLAVAVSLFLGWVLTVAVERPADRWLRRTGIPFARA